MNTSDDAGGFESPLEGPPPAEVPLPSAPLVRVIAQIRFSKTLALARTETADAFQRAIASEFPILADETPEGERAFGRPGALDDRVLRFRSADENWRASLATSFLALETLKYESRSDIIARLDRLIAALLACVAPHRIERVGLRYIDRIAETDLLQVERLFRPELLGVLASPWRQAMSRLLNVAEMEITEPAAKLRLLWGLLPPNHTIDPLALESIAQPSWIFDIDLFSESARPFARDVATTVVLPFAERIYAIFRWAVTDEFLRTYGGNP